MVKTTIKEHPGSRGNYTACHLLENYSGRAFVGSSIGKGGERNDQAIFWISHWAINAFGVHPNDYMPDAAWKSDTSCIFHVDRFIDIEVNEL